MAKAEISTKRLAISKSNAQMVGIVAAASFISVFCLVASKSVVSQNQYQARVIGGKETAHRQLQKNIKAFNDLQSSYAKWDSSGTNAIGGSSTGNGDKDGKNSKIVLDSLPSVYDFPALASSLEKILANKQLEVAGISGVDDELAQTANTTSPTPAVVAIPFSFSAAHASYSTVNDLIGTLEKSIRPIQIDTFSLAGGSTDMTLSVTAHTYYQPGKSLNITQKVQK